MAFSVSNAVGHHPELHMASYTSNLDPTSYYYRICSRTTDPKKQVPERTHLQRPPGHRLLILRQRSCGLFGEACPIGPSHQFQPGFEVKNLTSSMKKSVCCE